MSNRPNIVYILVDNLSWGDVSVRGGSVPTRRIDQVAATAGDEPGVRGGEKVDADFNLLAAAHNLARLVVLGLFFDPATGWTTAG